MAVTKGLDRKFGFGDVTYSLSSFESAVWKHLKECGLDLVFYFWTTDTSTGTVCMEEIITKHLRFLLCNIRTAVTNKKVTGTPVLYNLYDLRNLLSARTFLLHLLSPNLQHNVEQKITDNTSGPEIWMAIVEETQSDLTRRHQRICDQICTLCLTDFPAENVRFFNQHCLGMFKELDNADALDNDLLLCLLEVYTKSATETFRVTFITQRRDLEAYLCAIKGKTPIACRTIVGVKVFTYTSMMEDALSLYNSLHDSGDWMAATTVKQDRNGISAVSNHEANVLIASPTPFGKSSPVTCFNCGAPGHYSRDCLKPRKVLPQSGATFHSNNSNHSRNHAPTNRGGRNQGRGNQGHGNGSSNCRVWPAWQTKAPDNGKSEVRDFNGTTFYWCAICKHWRTTHSTNGIPADNVPRHTNTTNTNATNPPTHAGHYAVEDDNNNKFDW